MNNKINKNSKNIDIKKKDITSNNSIIVCKYCENKHNIIKKGIKGKYNKQIYYCKNCKKYFSIGKDNRIKRDEKLKELTLLLYSHNSSLRSIQNIIEKLYDTKISFCVICNWIKTMTKLLKIDIDNRNKEELNKDKEDKELNNNKEIEKEKDINKDKENKELNKYYNNTKYNNNNNKKYNNITNNIKVKRKTIDILEMDELWSYYYDIKKKEEKESKYGLLLIGEEIKLLHLK